MESIVYEHGKPESRGEIEAMRRFEERARRAQEPTYTPSRVIPLRRAACLNATHPTARRHPYYSGKKGNTQWDAN